MAKTARRRKAAVSVREVVMSAGRSPQVETWGYEWLSFGQRGHGRIDLALLCPIGTAIRSPRFQPGAGTAAGDGGPGDLNAGLLHFEQRAPGIHRLAGLDVELRDPAFVLGA